jgi:hypothetical protein
MIETCLPNQITSRDGSQAGLRSLPFPGSTPGRGTKRRRSSIRMSDCLVSRGLRVQFLPPAPTRFIVRAGAGGLSLDREELDSSARLIPGRQHARLPFALSWSGPAAEQMLRTLLAPPSPGRPCPLSSVEERRASNPYAGVRLAQRAPSNPTCLARRTQGALLKRPRQVRLLGGAPSRRGRSAARMPACHVGDRGASPLRGPK